MFVYFFENETKFYTFLNFSKKKKRIDIPKYWACRIQRKARRVFFFLVEVYFLPFGPTLEKKKVNLFLTLQNVGEKIVYVTEKRWDNMGKSRYLL